MSTATPHTFTVTLTPEQVQTAKNNLKQHYNVEVTSNTGSFEHDGAKIQYQITDNSVVFAIISKPFYVTDAFVENKIKTSLGL